MRYILSAEKFIFIYFFAVKFGGYDVKQGICLYEKPSELNVDNWNDNCEAESKAKRPRPLRGLQVDSSLTCNVSYAV